jgi:class 3 adenylate cyclase
LQTLIVGTPTLIWYSFAGVFGVPVLVAEQLESAAKPNTTLCSAEAQAAYVASSYAFSATRVPEVCE